MGRIVAHNVRLHLMDAVENGKLFDKRFQATLVSPGTRTTLLDKWSGFVQAAEYHAMAV